MAKRTEARLAASRGLKELFKFRPFRTKENHERVREILVDHKVYFSRPSQLNDPFDLSPLFEFSNDRNTLLQEAEASWHRRRPPLSDDELRGLRNAFTHGSLDDLRKEGTQRARTRIEQYWVLSLAGNRDHPMLWSHYADGHTGICIHFASDGSSIFGGSQQIWYKPKRPVVPVPITLSDEEAAARITLTKGDFWKYEQEFRFIRYPGVPFDDVGLRFIGQHAHFSPRLLTGVTVGTRTSSADISVLRDLVKQHGLDLPIWRAVEQRAYEFKFERLI
jgi:hypothetical protein